MLIRIALAIVVTLLTACGGSDEPIDEPTMTTIPIDCHASPNQCK